MEKTNRERDDSVDSGGAMVHGGGFEDQRALFITVSRSGTKRAWSWGLHSALSQSGAWLRGP